jgi:RNA polymerase sigma-70 factor (ECF subfamily)
VGARAAALGALPDRECLILARGGSRAALGELAGRHLPTVYRLCSRLMRNRDDAADATQEVFLRACRALARFDPERSFRAWLCAIAWNLVRDHARRAKHRRGPPAAEAPVEPADHRQRSPFERLAEKERATALEAALDRLRPQARALLLLKETEGLSYEEIAQLFGCSLGTVKSRIHRSRLELKNILLALQPELFS